MERLQESVQALPAEEVARVITSTLSKESLTKFMQSTLQGISPEIFGEAWGKAPKPLQSTVWAAPPDVNVNWKELPRNEQKDMCLRLNQLRRERCLPLAPEADRMYWSVLHFSLKTQHPVQCICGSILEKFEVQFVPP